MSHNPYDEVPYPKYIHPQTQPDKLATLGTLFGLQPPPVERCRVLDVGCASGVNTMAMAMTIPHGQFVGIDGSAQQIKYGQDNSQRLGLTNITLKHLNIMEVTPEFGQFDYIVVHGVYSWVPPAVRAQILQICSQNLHPQGIAYVSYNVSPGWNINNTFRKILLYRTKDLTAPKDKLAQTRQLLNFLTGAVKDKFDSYSLLLREELRKVSEEDDNYLYHEYLEDDNDPLYFHEFVEQAHQHGLQYVTDIKAPFIALDEFFAQEAGDFEMPLLEKEQYMDFLRNNAFRETLLCHQGLTLQRSLSPDLIDQFYIAAPLKPASPELGAIATYSETQFSNDALEMFNNAAGEAVISIASPLLKIVCLYLGEMWPQNLSFDHLMQKIDNLLKTATVSPENYQTIMSPANIKEVKTLLLEFYLKKIVELHVYPPQFTLTLSERPVASPLARWQSQYSEEVTNLRHETFALDFASRHLLNYLDGQHDRHALMDKVLESVQAGKLQFYQGDEPKTLTELDQTELHQYLSRYLEDTLQKLARKAYLVA